MQTAYAILFIDKATQKIIRAQFASNFPVAGLFSEAQVVLAESTGSNYDVASRQLRDVLRARHAWARTLFREVF